MHYIWFKVKLRRSFKKPTGVSDPAHMCYFKHAPIESVKIKKANK